MLTKETGYCGFGDSCKFAHDRLMRVDCCYARLKRTSRDWPRSPKCLARSGKQHSCAFFLDWEVQLGQLTWNESLETYALTPLA